MTISTSTHGSGSGATTAVQCNTGHGEDPLYFNYLLFGAGAYGEVLDSALPILATNFVADPISTDEVYMGTTVSITGSNR